MEWLQKNWVMIIVILVISFGVSYMFGGKEGPRGLPGLQGVGSEGTGFGAITYVDANADADQTRDWTRGQLGDGDDLDTFRNLSTNKESLIIDHFEAQNTSSSTGSFYLSVVATTSSTIPNGQDFATQTLRSASGLDQAFLMDRYKFPTSTFAATTTNFVAQQSGVGSDQITLPYGHYLHVYLQGECANAASVDVCALATSSSGNTKRGFKVDYNISYRTATGTQPDLRVQ